MTNNPRYTLGTEANRIFMASETYELLKFGKGFPAPNGGSGWLNADGTSTLPRRRNVDHQPYGPCVFDWCPCSDTWVRASWPTRRSRD